MSTQNLLAKSRRLFVPVLMAGLLLGFVFASLSGVQAAPLHSYGSNPQLRWITVTASGGVVVSDTQPNQAPASGSKTVYFRDFTPGTITVTPDVTGTAPLTVVREIGLDSTTLLTVSAATAPLIQPIPDGPISNAGSQDVTFTLQNNLGASSVFTISFAEDKFTPTVGIIAPTAGQILTLSAQPNFSVVMTATDPNEPEASGIKSVQVITGAGGAAQAGVTTDDVQWTYNWTLPTEENVAHTLLVTATDYVGNYVTITRSITIDTQGPITTSVVLTSSHVINTWYPTSTVVMTWTGFSDAGDGVSSYLYLWDSSASTVITPGTNGVASTGNVTHVAKSLSSTSNYYFHVAALDTNGNWSGTVMTGPFKIDTVAPTGGSVSINAGATYATSTAVTLTLNAADATSGLAQMAFSNDGTTWLTQTYATTASWTLSSGDGTKTVYAHFVDNAGNVSGNASDIITLDMAAPTGGSISINAGATYATSTAVTLTLNASDATSGLYQMAFSNDGTTWITQPYGTSANWTLTSGDGAKTVYARFVDNVGNISGNTSDAITLDTAAPTGGSVNINAGATYATSTAVTLTLNAADATSGLAQMAFSNDGTTWFTQTFATSTNWTLSAGDGIKTVYVRFADNAGNVSTNVSDTIFLDHVAPTISSPDLSITFNPGSALYHPFGTTTLYYTNTSGGSFRVAGLASDLAPASGLDHVTFSTAFGGTPPDDASPAVFGGDYDLYSGATESGLITATVFDKAGNSRTQPYTYQLDADPPYTGSININAGAQYVSQTQVNLALLSTDTQSGVAEMCLSNSSSCTTWETFATTKSWVIGNVDGVKTVWVWFRDNLHNAAGPFTDTITLDQQAPTGGSININGGATYANQVTVTLALSATDATSGLAQMAFSNDGTTWITQTYATTANWTLTSGDGAKTVYVRFVDNAGNVSGNASDTITLDTIAPTGGSISINAGATYAASTSVTLTLSASDATSGVSQMAFSNDGTTWVTQTYALSANWTLSAGDGVKTVYVRFSDNAGNVGGNASDTIVLDRQPPNAPTANSNHTANAWSNNNILVMSVITATDPAPSSGLSGYAVVWDNAALTIPAQTVNLAASATTTSTTVSSDGDWYFHIRAQDAAGNWGVAQHFGPYRIDIAAPAAPTANSDHTANAWSNNNTLVMSAITTTDSAPSSGLSGYAVVWDTAPTTTPPATVNLTVSAATTSTTVADGDWYFHIRAQDGAGNWGAAQHFGPYRIDRATPAAPTASSNHTVNVWSNNNILVMSVITATDPAPSSGLSGYAAVWDNAALTIPAQTVNLAASATTTSTTVPSDGDWYFHIRAQDAAGNWGATQPFGPYRIDTTAPVITLTMPARVVTLNDTTAITINWSSFEVGSGVAGFNLSYTGSDGSYQPYTFAASELSTTLTLTRDVVYTFTLSATDGAGNVSLSDQAQLLIAPFRTYLPNVLKNYPPLPTGSVIINNGAAFTYNPTVTLTPSATVSGDTVPPQMRFSNDGVTWSVWEDLAASKSWTLPVESGLKTVYAQFKGSAGGISQAVSDSILLFNNGNFEADWTQWAHGQDGFTINSVKHGTGLAQSIVPIGTDHVLQLGTPAYVDGSIPVGYGYASQTFVVPAGEKRVTLTYLVHSLDAVYGSATPQYFDTFEVSLQPPASILNGERDAKGCKDSARINPTGTLTPASADSLIFCGGAPKGNAGAFDTGWKTVTIDLSNFTAGQSVTLYFAVWNREYTSPFYNDKGYYNTYAFVNDVRFGP